MSLQLVKRSRDNNDVYSYPAQMNFYKYFYCIMTFLALYLKGAGSLSNKNLIVMRSGVEPINPGYIGLVLFADVNNTLDDVDFDVELTPDQCCLQVGSNEICNVMEIEGECVDSISKGSSKTLRLVAPLIEPFERRGYCVVYLDSKPKARHRKSMRNMLKISFDTHIKSTKLATKLFGNISACSDIDEDPLNECKPVDCETYYNGQRSFFDVKTKRCVDVPLCLSNNAYEVPNIIYDKKKNKCIEGKSISDSDLGLIKKLTSSSEGKRTKDRKTKDILIINNSAKLPNLYGDVLNNNITRTPLFDSLKYKELKKKGFMYLLSNSCSGNRCTMYALAAVVLIQCFFICLLVYCFSNACSPCSKKKIVRKFFNCHQDASVTTPLICTSNVDTDTTEFQYFSESSNIDNKIKCYKSCQKERLNNAKMCMSDDILSKCITRRDWNCKPTRSEALAGSNISDENNLMETPKKDLKDGDRNASVRYQTQQSNESNRKPSNVKVNFENEQSTQKKEKKRSSNIVRTPKKSDCKNKMAGKDYEDTQCGASEMEIKCHSYKYMDDEPNVTGFMQTSSKRLGFFKTDKNKVNDMSKSIEKGAQAAFSNDSLDDFLSERGVLFLAGDDLSKYSFSSHSNDVNASSLSSGMSSKTSKNNVVKNVLSLLHRKSSGPSSDPGAKKKEDNLNMEVLHMSTASVFSSNNDSEYLKSLRQTKDSRTSL